MTTTCIVVYVDINTNFKIVSTSINKNNYQSTAIGLDTLIPTRIRQLVNMDMSTSADMTVNTMTSDPTNTNSTTNIDTKGNMNTNTGNNTHIGIHTMLV